MSEPAELPAISRQLLAGRKEITDEWLLQIAGLQDLQRLPPSAVVDHLPEFLHELALATAGRSEATRRAYQLLITGHALQRLGLGVELSTLLEEYAEVHNLGSPIPEEQIPTLFDAFRRGEAAHPGGLGLGLYIVQQIAHAHGGECVVRSSETEGTTFSIRWPRTPLTAVPRPYQRQVGGERG